MLLMAYRPSCFPRYHVWFFLQGQMRLSKKMLDPEKPQLGMIDRWYHPSCFVQSREELGFRPEYSASQLKGFGLLTPEDKEALKKQLPGVKAEGWVEGCGRGLQRGSVRGLMERGPETPQIPYLSHVSSCQP